jgi:hypothetical protein
MEKEARGEGRERWACDNVVKKEKERSGEKEGKGGHGTMFSKKKMKARVEGRERWACDNVLKKGKGCLKRGKGKVGT